MDDKKIVGLAINQEFARWALPGNHARGCLQKTRSWTTCWSSTSATAISPETMTSSILSEMGAEVIRIEPPEGNIARKMTPYGMMIRDSGLAYIVEGRNKFHVTLDLTKQEGHNIFVRLANKAGWSSRHSSRASGRLGSGTGSCRATNPGLIIAPSTATVITARMRKNTAISRTTISSIRPGASSCPSRASRIWTRRSPTYKRPLKQGNWMGWYAGGAWAGLGILMAMFHKRTRARGK